MAANQLEIVDDEFAMYWSKFRLFPTRWANALFSRQSNLILLFSISYGLVLWSLRLSNNGFGEVVIGWLELHLLALGVLLAFLSYVRWIAKIPAIFEWLRKPTQRVQTQSGDFNIAYLDYLQEYQKNLHSKRHSVLSSSALIIIAIVGASLLLVANGASVTLLFTHIPYLFPTLFFVLWAYIAGPGVWTMYTTMRHIRKLCRHFQINIQPSHPDKCGGLEPLGDFCFAMSLPALIMGLAASVVGVGGSVLFYSGIGNALYDSLGLGTFNPWLAFGTLAAIIVIILPLVAISFFVPLWDIHRYMEVRRRKSQDDFANHVAELEKRIRLQMDVKGGLAVAKSAKEELLLLREAILPTIVNYPVWPFQPKLLIKLFSPQIISSAGFALGIYQAIWK